MLKKEAILVYRNLDPTDESKMKKDLSALTAYHEERGRYTEAEAMRREIPPVVWKMLSPPEQEYLNLLSEEVEGGSESAADQKAAAAEEIQMATNMVAMELFAGCIGSYVLQGKTRYITIDPATNDCAIVMRERKEFHYTLMTELIRHTAETPVTAGTGASYRVANDKNMHDALHFVLGRVPVYEDVPVYSVDPEEVSYYHPAIIPDKEGKWENIERWFGRLTDGGALAAWIWGVYTCQYLGRQIPYLQGGSETQKSLYINHILSELFGSACVALSAKDIKRGNQFFLSGLEKSKVALIPDNQNPYIFKDEWMKDISGHDPVRIEGKNDPSVRSVTLATNIIVLSNFLPYVSSEGYATSRAMLLEIPDWEGDAPWVTRDEITAEIPGFLAYAADCWERLIDDAHYKIQVNAHTSDLVKQANDRYEGEFIGLVGRRFEVEEGALLPASEVRSILRSELSSRSDQLFSRFAHFCQYKHGITHEIWSGKEFLVGIKLTEESVVGGNKHPVIEKGAKNNDVLKEKKKAAILEMLVQIDSEKEVVKK